MDTTFITIQDLTAESRILYVSDSIVDILGYVPEEVVRRSSWEFFHPKELPFAQAVYGRGIRLDKAAVLNYARLKHRNGQWIGCECVFSIVNDVLVGCTSRYNEGPKAQKRAMDAPIVRQLFSSSPKDPRYHMLSYISNKFTQPSDPHAREPRAALFLNRFTRTLPVMFASNGLRDVLGISADQLHNKSFYYCMQEACLPEAIKCLESAKANDSIAYLRFWYRDPREEAVPEPEPAPRNQNRVLSTPTSDQDDDEEEGGVALDSHMETDHSDSNDRGISGYNSSTSGHHDISARNESTRSSGRGSHPPDIFDQPQRATSTAATTPFNETPGLSGTSGSRTRTIELEAVVSCTSDGLVVILRQARPFALDTIRQRPAHYRNGVFASPWASEPILPSSIQTEQMANSGAYNLAGEPIYHQGYTGEGAAKAYVPPVPANEHIVDDFMHSIREVAVFAWALTGINGCLERYSRGTAMPGSVPTQMPIWERHAAGLEQVADRIMSG